MIVTGKLLEWRNERENFADVLYASVTAKDVVRCDVFIEEQLIDSVWAGNGGSHSWWGYGGIGKLIPPDKYPNGIPPNKRLRMVCTGDACMRVDFYP
jgi:hypothetical protein